MPYAEGTSVSSSQSQQEIERMTARYGARSFMYGRDDERGVAIVAFVHNDRQVRFLLPIPDRRSAEFWETPTRRNRRSPAQAEAGYEQAVKARWRALLLIIKAKFEAIETGITSFDQEFLPHFVLPSGRTVSEEILPGVQEAYETGKMPASLLPRGLPKHREIEA